MHLKVYKDFLCLKVLFMFFSEPISSLLLYHWIQFSNARKNFHVQLWFIFAQKRIQTAGLSKYFVNYTKYIMACTLRSKSLCSRIWIVIPRQLLIVFRSLISFFQKWVANWNWQVIVCFCLFFYSELKHSMKFALTLYSWELSSQA